MEFAFQVIAIAIPVIYAITVHEVAHGLIAKGFGDFTASRQGRLTLNPIAHIDMVGTVILPALLIYLGGLVFGWAKPVPVDARYLKNPKEDMVKVAAAGPISNIILAIIAALALKFLFSTGLITNSIKTFFIIFMQINITLAVFNLLPVSPLDGSQILSPFLEKKFGSDIVWKMQLYGPRILFFIILFSMVTDIHIFSFIITPIFNFFILIFF